MPDCLLAQGKRHVGWLSEAGDYKPGDLPPSGYGDWREWARVQTKAGLTQERCGRCGLLKFPQEISHVETNTSWAYPTKRDALNRTNAVAVIGKVPICLECATDDAGD